MRAIRLIRVALTVSDLDAAEAFYTTALGFVRQIRQPLATEIAHLLGAQSGEQLLLTRGGQTLALETLDPAGDRYPADTTACDQCFQHIALPAPDIGRAFGILPGTARAISRDGPQRLPQSSGGATAYKFRDPEGHPLELIELPTGNDHGIDHSAIVVADAERSIAFYRDQLGLHLAARQTNTGPAQDRLDGLDHVSVEVIALEPEQATPHIELLAYRTPPVRSAVIAPRATAATRLVLEMAGLDHPALRTDPDGHHLLVMPSS